MFARIMLVFALLGGWVTLGVTPASAVGPNGTGRFAKAGMITSSVGAAPTKNPGCIGCRAGGKTGGSKPNHR